MPSQMDIAPWCYKCLDGWLVGLDLRWWWWWLSLGIEFPNWTDWSSDSYWQSWIQSKWRLSWKLRKRVNIKKQSMKYCRLLKTKFWKVDKGRLSWEYLHIHNPYQTASLPQIFEKNSLVLLWNSALQSCVRVLLWWSPLLWLCLDWG